MEHEHELADIGTRLADDAYTAWHAAEANASERSLLVAPGHGQRCSGVLRLSRSLEREESGSPCAVAWSRAPRRRTYLYSGMLRTCPRPR